MGKGITHILKIGGRKKGFERALWVLVVMFTLTAILGAPNFLFAAPPASPYAPGETLDPSCSPGASNCTVEQIYVATTTQSYGIGTTSPLARLTVSATSSLSNFSLFRVEAVPSLDATTTALIVTSSGNVGIGTTSPYASLALEMNTTNPAFVISNQGSTTPAFYVGGVNQNGFVGIGTTSPSTASDKLAIYGGSFFQSVASTTGPYASDQTGMRVVGTLSLPSAVNVDLKISNNYVYILDDTNDALDIIDISNPIYPKLISTLLFPGGNVSKGEIEIVGHYAYISHTTGGGWVVDISNPASPKIVLVSGLILGSNHGMTSSGTYLYTASQASTFTITDISNPISPKAFPKITITEGIPVEVAVGGQYAYVIGSGSDILEVIDISNPSLPKSISTVSLGVGAPSDIKVVGRYAYTVGTDTVGTYLKIVDISIPQSPSVIGTIYISPTAKVSVNGRYAYAIGGSTMTVVDVASSTNPINVGTLSGTSFANIDSSGRYIYTIDGGVLNVIDTSGIEVQSAIVHSLEAGSLTTRGSASVGGALSVTGSAVFSGNLLSEGGGAFVLSTTSSLSNITALSAGISDTNNSSIVDIANLFHTSTSSDGATLPSAGIGAGLLFSSADASWFATSTSRIASILTNVSTTSPASALTFSNKNIAGSLTEFMRLDSSGRLGIGTTSPWAKLSVAGTAANGTTPLFTVSSSTLTATTTVFHIDYTGNVGIGTTSPYAKLSVVGEVVGANFTATSTTATSTFMGGVGIGTTTPSAPLSVSGNAYFSGNVGIGIAIPAYPLDVYGGSVNINTGALNLVGSNAIYKSSGELRFGWNSVFTSQTFYISGSESMRLNSTGNLGLGTTSPYGLLSISTTTIPVIPLFVIATSTSGTSSSTPFIVDRYGNVGIGTTSPWRTLSVTGTVAINGLTSNASADAVCILANKEITTAGGAVCNGVSSQRFKHDIENADLGLSTILAMRPVSFRYNEGYGDSGKVQQFGLIAEETYAIDPRLAVLDAQGLPTTVRYDFLSPILIKAVQELNLKLDQLASTSVASAQNQSSLLAWVTDWIGNSIQAVKGIFGRVETKELCVEDICVTKEAFKAVFGSAVSPDPSPESPISDIIFPTITIIGNPSTTSSQSSDGYGASNPAADVEPPLIKLIGNNPATIDVGTPYLDLGATVDDNVDHNLGLQTSGAEINTSISGTYAVLYTATDQAGNTSTSTRTVIVKEPLIDVPPEPSPGPLPLEGASTTVPTEGIE